MSTDPPAAMRERFEKWAKTPRENEWHWEEWAFERGASGEYLGASVDSAWAAWQASLPSEAGIEAVARRIAGKFISGLRADGIDSTPDAESKVASSVAAILREWLGKDSHAQTELLGRDPE